MPFAFGPLGAPERAPLRGPQEPLLKGAPRGEPFLGGPYGTCIDALTQGCPSRGGAVPFCFCLVSVYSPAAPPAATAAVAGPAAAKLAPNVSTAALQVPAAVAAVEMEAAAAAET